MNAGPIGRHGGAASVEFVLAMMLMLLPALFAALELGQLAVTRHLLDLATFEAARTASLHAAAAPATEPLHIDEAGLRAAVARGLVSLFGATRPADDAQLGSAMTALVRARLELARPDLAQLTMLAHTHHPPGSGRARLAALDLTVRYCRRLVFPLTDWALRLSVSAGTFSAFDRGCLVRGRWPIEARSRIVLPA